ncbi:MAG: hypothetical protein LQ340_000278 [Diploschistes diacapsis]|nr:MAG: hypothetical protein LQ340_000278 [Diploschistes diacapsis]
MSRPSHQSLALSTHPFRDSAWVPPREVRQHRCPFQDPAFTKTDRQYLKQRGHKVLPYTVSRDRNIKPLDPAALKVICEATFLFEPYVDRRVVIEVVCAGRPSLYLGPDLARDFAYLFMPVATGAVPFPLEVKTVVQFPPSGPCILQLSLEDATCTLTFLPGPLKLTVPDPKFAKLRLPLTPVGVENLNCVTNPLFAETFELNAASGVLDPGLNTT